MPKRTIWKFPIPNMGEFSLNMPMGAKMLTVQMQGNVPTIWAEVDPKAPTVDYGFAAHPTGGTPFDTTWAEYIDTFQMLDGALVFHLYYLSSWRRSHETA